MRPTASRSRSRGRWPALVRLFGPVLTAINWLVRRILASVGIRIGETEPILSAHDELRGAVDFFHREGSVEKQDRDMLGGLLELRDLTVADVMIHRTEVIAVDVGEPPKDAVGGGAGRAGDAGAAVARQAGEHRRHPARQGPAARAAEGRAATPARSI